MLTRAGFACRMCGAAAGDPHPDTGGRVTLNVGHIVSRRLGGEESLDNLQALCATCNLGAKGLTLPPPSWAWLSGHIRRARIDDQRRALDWLTDKFAEGQ